MSYLPINEQNQQAPTGQTTNAPQGTPPPQQSGGSVGGGSTGGAKGSATGSPAQFGSSASKLGDYLSANAPQITNQANTLAGTLNNQYGQIQGDITNAANQFGQTVNAGYTAPNQDIVNQALSNPSQFTQDPNNVSAFQAQYNNQYTGPQNFESTAPYSNIQNEVSNAVSQGNLLGSQAGLQSYLQGKGSNPTRASSTLDSLLLTGNPEAKETVSNAAKQFGNLTGQFGDTTTNANASVQAAKKSAQDSATAAKGQVDPYVKNFGDTLNTGAASAEANRQAFNTNQQQAYDQLTPIQQYLQQFSGQTGIQFENNPLTPYLQQNQVTNPITTQNYATPEQYQQAAAIQQLLGGNAQLPIGADTANMAGTAPTVPTNAGAYNLSDLLKPLIKQSDTGAQKKLMDLEYNQHVKSTDPRVTNTVADYNSLLSELMGYAPSLINKTSGGYAPNYENLGS